MSTRSLSWLGVFVACVLCDLGAAGAALAKSRWDSIPCSAANPIHMQGSLVVHDNDQGVYAFSSTTQRFLSIAPKGTPILGTGDNLAVVKLGTVYRAWSARVNQWADLPQSLPLSYSAFGDDVALLVFSNIGGGQVACAYSAVTNQWKTIAGTFPGSIATNAAVSRFVIAVKMTSAVSGFSARKGEWVALPNSTLAQPPQADGNVAVTSGAIKVTGDHAAAAFSGVLGTWVVSNPTVPGSPVALDHNVALCRTANGLTQWIAQGYSAYNGRWISSTIVHNNVQAQGTWHSDNVMAVSSAGDPTPGIEAFGARPGLAFAFLPSTLGGLFMPFGEDYLICNPTITGKTIHVFSGLANGSFLTHTFGNIFTVSFGPAHQFLAIDTAGTMVGYSAAKHAFATMPKPMFYDVEVKDALSEVREIHPSSARFHTFTARHGHFTASPVQEPGATFITASAGSLVARQQTNLTNAGCILVYDERCDRYATPFKPGGPTTMTAGRNVVLVARDAAPFTVSGYSVARSDWQGSPSAAGGSPLVAPVVEENVGYFVDSAGALCAFGGDGDLHAFYSWPNDTEYQTFGVASGQLSIAPSPMSLAFGGEVGDVAYFLFAFGFKFPGLTVGGFANKLHVDPATLNIVGPLGAIGASRILPIHTSGGTLAAPLAFQIWMQSLLTGGPSANWLGQRVEGVWLF